MALLRAASRAIACLACTTAALLAHAQGASEPSVKAAFLYKFASYVEWPAASRRDAPFVIATFAGDEVAAELAALLPGRAIAGRPAVVRTVREGEPLRDVQILFIGKRATEARALVRAAQEQGVLTVSETSLEASGAAINFVVVENRVAFEVSLEAADKTGHRISSRMLAVARRVVPKASS